MMKKNYIHIYLLGILLLSVACTGKFREFIPTSPALQMKI